MVSFWRACGLTVALLLVPAIVHAEINVTAYGANPNDTVDDTVAIRNGIAAASGQTLYFPPQTSSSYGYIVSSAFTISQPMTLKGSGSIIRNGAFSVQADNVTVDGLWLIGPRETGGFALWGIGKTNIKFINNTVDRYKDAITVSSVSGFTINNNTIRNIGYAAILTGSSRNGVIYKNNISAVGYNTQDPSGNAYGVTLTGSNPFSQNIMVSSNRVVNVPLWECFDTHGGIDLTFRANYCENSMHGMAMGYGTQNTLVEKNTIIHGANWNEAIYMIGTSDGSRIAQGVIRNNVTNYSNHDGVGIYIARANVVKCGNKGLTVQQPACPDGQVGGGSTMPDPAATVVADTQPPTAPTSLTAAAASSSQINLSWMPGTDNVGIVSHRIERCTGSSCTSFVQIATTSNSAFANTGLAAGTYRYRVRSADAAGNLSAYSAIASATVGAGTISPAPVVSNVQVINVTRTSATITWYVQPATTGQVEYGRTTSYGLQSVFEPTRLTYHAQKLSNLRRRTIYHYRIRGTDANGVSVPLVDRTFKTR